MRAFHGMPGHSRGRSRRRNGSRTCPPLPLPLISVQPLSQITNLRGARKRPGFLSCARPCLHRQPCNPLYHGSLPVGVCAQPTKQLFLITENLACALHSAAHGVWFSKLGVWDQWRMGMETQPSNDAQTVYANDRQ